MRKRSAWILGSVLLALLLIFGASCAKKEVAPVEGADTAREEAAAQQAAEDEAARREMERLRAERARATADMSEEARRRAFEEENVHFLEGHGDSGREGGMVA